MPIVPMPHPAFLLSSANHLRLSSVFRMCTTYQMLRNFLISNLNISVLTALLNSWLLSLWPLEFVKTIKTENMCESQGLHLLIHSTNKQKQTQNRIECRIPYTLQVFKIQTKKKGWEPRFLKIDTKSLGEIKSKIFLWCWRKIFN